MIYTDMSLAPTYKRILIKTKIMCYKKGSWVYNGFRWIECWWDNDSTWTGQSCWQPWCGSYHTRSTEEIIPVAWTLLPLE